MSGFEGRIFLLEHEYETYMRRMPVRYLKTKLAPVCFICGLGPEADNPFERAHRIPFGEGIRKFRLTPDFLDQDTNVVTAHRKICNSAAELSESEVLALIKEKAHLSGLSVPTSD